MATIFTKIQRKVSNDEFDFLNHCLDELADENFLPSESVSAVLNPFNYLKAGHNSSRSDAMSLAVRFNARKASSLSHRRVSDH